MKFADEWGRARKALTKLLADTGMSDKLRDPMAAVMNLLPVHEAELQIAMGSRVPTLRELELEEGLREAARYFRWVHEEKGEPIGVAAKLRDMENVADGWWLCPGCRESVPASHTYCGDCGRWRADQAVATERSQDQRWSCTNRAGHAFEVPVWNTLEKCSEPGCNERRPPPAASDLQQWDPDDSRIWRCRSTPVCASFGEGKGRELRDDDTICFRCGAPRPPEQAKTLGPIAVSNTDGDTIAEDALDRPPESEPTSLAAQLADTLRRIRDGLSATQEDYKVSHSGDVLLQRIANGILEIGTALTYFESVTSCQTCGGAGFTVTGPADSPEQVPCEDCFQERVFGKAGTEEAIERMGVAIGWLNDLGIATRTGDGVTDAELSRVGLEIHKAIGALEGKHGEVVEVWEVPPELEPLREVAREVHKFFSERTPHPLSCKPAHHYRVTEQIAHRFVEMSKAALRLAGEQVSDLDALMENMAAQAEEERGD